MINKPSKKEDSAKLISSARHSLLCKNWLFVPVIVCCILLLKYVLPFHICKVNGNSMLPNYQDGQILLADKLREESSEINRYDVVIAKSDIGIIIKRVVGLPGEHLEIREDGFVYIGDIKLEKLNDYHLEEMFFTDPMMVEMGENEYFLMGDNVNHSSDSRLLGCFQKDQILGIVNHK